MTKDRLNLIPKFQFGNEEKAMNNDYDYLIPQIPIWLAPDLIPKLEFGNEERTEIWECGKIGFEYEKQNRYN